MQNWPCLLRVSMPVLKESFYLIQADSRVMIETGCCSCGFLPAPLKKKAIWWMEALFLIKLTCGGQVWHCKHPKMLLWHHRHPAVALRVHIAFLLLFRPRENPDVAPDCGLECLTASKASKVCPPYPLAWETEFLLGGQSLFPSQACQLWLLALLRCQLLPYTKPHMQASKRWPAPQFGGSIHKTFDGATAGLGSWCCSWTAWRISGRTWRGQTCFSGHTSEKYFDQTR